MTEFMEIKHNDWCHFCEDDQKRHKNLLNYNSHKHGHSRICLDCLAKIIEVKKNEGM